MKGSIYASSVAPKLQEVFTIRWTQIIGDGDKDKEKKNPRESIQVSATILFFDERWMALDGPLGLLRPPRRELLVRRCLDH